MATVMMSSMIGSARGKPSITPTAPITTASEASSSGARVQPVGDQCRRTDAVAHADAVDGDELVAGEAEEAGDQDHGEVRSRQLMMRVRQLATCSIAGRNASRCSRGAHLPEGDR